MILLLDAGGTRIKYGIADSHGTLYEQGSAETPREGINEFLAAAAKIKGQMGQRWPLQGAAFSLPGEVHGEEGVVRGISAIPYIHGINLRDRLREALGLEAVVMENDAKCAAMGELWKGEAAGCRDAVFVICGTGIGGAVVENGKIYRGITLNRGEFGNFPMGGFEGGKLLTWSDFTMEKQARKYRKQKGLQEKISGKALVQLAGAGDSLAKRLVEEFYYWMAVGCITLEFAFDPERIIIGGGISENAELIEGIQRTARQLLKGQRSGYLEPDIRACRNGNRANLYGALYCFLNQERAEKKED